MQIIFGTLVVMIVKILSDLKAGEPFISSSGEIWIGFPADSNAEYILVILGLLITICGYIQRRTQVKYATLQVISGLIIVITFTALGIRATALGYLERSHLYYFVYLLIIPGSAVALLGIIQFVRAILLKYGKNSAISNISDKTQSSLKG
jgi:hypothetical protein